LIHFLLPHSRPHPAPYTTLFRSPIPREFDDYISRPKANLYRSLHTAVIGPQGKALEVQIRTHEMHRDAELGVAAHWRYKEGAKRPGGKGDPFDERIAWLPQMLAWRDEIVDSSDGVQQHNHAVLHATGDDTAPAGRAAVARGLQGGGGAVASLEGVGKRRGSGKPGELFAAVGHEEVGPRQLRTALRGEPERAQPPQARLKSSSAGRPRSGI